MSRVALLVLSDLDGTLLDHTTYAFDAARAALDRLHAARVPLVLCTSKTRAEVEPIRAALDNAHPFIVENGGGVYVPPGYFPFEIEGAERRGDYAVIPLGDSYAELRRALERASRASGVGARGFADMTDDEVAAETGLTPLEARLARQREFDEPFVVLEPARAPELLAAIWATCVLSDSGTHLTMQHSCARSTSRSSWPRRAWTSCARSCPAAASRRWKVRPAGARPCWRCSTRGVRRFRRSPSLRPHPG